MSLIGVGAAGCYWPELPAMTGFRLMQWCLHAVSDRIGQMLLGDGMTTILAGVLYVSFMALVMGILRGGYKDVEA